MGLRLSIVFVFVVLLAFAQPSKAEDPAIAQVEALLQNPKALQELAAQDPRAAQALIRAESLTSSDPRVQQQLMEVSASIFRSLAQENSDPKTLQEKVMEWTKDPQKMERFLSAEQREAVRKLASEVAVSQPQRTP